METITKQQLNEWLLYYNQTKNGYHMSKNDYHEFIRLNHLIMETTHDIHNHNMTKNLNIF